MVLMASLARVARGKILRDYVRREELNLLNLDIR
jgi:hypothetical protein